MAETTVTFTDTRCGYVHPSHGQCVLLVGHGPRHSYVVRVSPADPSPVPARDDAPDDAPELLGVIVRTNDGFGQRIVDAFSVLAAWRLFLLQSDERRVLYARVPSPDVLRAECEALGEVLEAENDACLAQAVAELRDTLTRVLRARRALLAAVTRDGEAP
jgi:hypothetical protein